MALAPGSLLGRLFDAPMRPGEVTWIGFRTARRQPVESQDKAILVAGQGLEGDRYASRDNGARQVTLIGVEELAAIASYLGRADVAPELLRRNLVTRGINLLALRHRRFRVGSALLEMSGECAPCSRMEENLGAGGYNAVRGRGGITARVIENGIVRLGERIVRAD